MLLKVSFSIIWCAKFLNSKLFNRKAERWSPWMMTFGVCLWLNEGGNTHYEIFECDATAQLFASKYSTFSKEWAIKRPNFTTIFCFPLLTLFCGRWLCCSDAIHFPHHHFIVFFFFRFSIMHLSFIIFIFITLFF